MPLDVICPNCGECYFETNDEDGVLQTDDERSREVLFRNFKKRDGVLFKSFDDKPVTGRLSDYVRKYDPDAPANAAMIRMKPEFVGIREDIQHDRDLTGFAIEPCPNMNCGQSLSDDSFKFITRPQTDDPDEARICGDPRGHSTRPGPEGICNRAVPEYDLRAVFIE